MTLSATHPPVLSSYCKAAVVSALSTYALGHNGGGRGWRQWKARSLEEVMDLILRSPRMEPLGASLEGDFDIDFAIRCPVPRWPKQDRLVIGDRVVCHLRYQDQWRFESPPGWGPVSIAWPHDVFSSNSLPHLRGALCLGDLPPNAKPIQIILAAYDALTLQSHNLDETHPAGVLNALASDFYRRRPQYLPLTTAGLLDPAELDPREYSP